MRKDGWSDYVVQPAVPIKKLVCSNRYTNLGTSLDSLGVLWGWPEQAPLLSPISIDINVSIQNILSGANKIEDQTHSSNIRSTNDNDILQWGHHSGAMYSVLNIDWCLKGLVTSQGTRLYYWNVKLRKELKRPQYIY